jgi:hypothetical protein
VALGLVAFVYLIALAGTVRCVSSALHLARFKVSRDLTAERIFYGPLRTGMPTLLGVVGKAVDTGEIVAVVAFEWPDRYAQKDQLAIEQVQVERFVRDHTRGVGSPPFVRFARGGKVDEFPDFWSWDESGTQTVLECTQLVVGDRVAALDQFRDVEAAVLAALPERFLHLQGHIAYVSFDEAVGIGRSPKKRAEREREVINALSAYRPVVSTLDEKQLGGWSVAPMEQLDASTVQQFDGGHVTAASLAAGYSSTFSSAKGFELALNFPTEIFEVEAWNLLQSRVRDKDLVDGAHTLLVSAGSPTSGTGLAFPSDSVLASVVLEAAETRVLNATRLRRIWLHDWSTESVHVLTPGKPGARRLCGLRLA